MNNCIEIFVFISMMIIVLISWFRHNANLRRTIAYTVWTFAIFWINTPNFFYAVEGLNAKYSIFNLPFKLYNNLGLWYIILSNILLAFTGEWIGKSWNQTNRVNEKTIKKKFDEFSNDASELRIIGRDLDFLDNKDYADQRAHISKLKNKAMLLCEKTDKKDLIKLYNNLMKDGNRVRYYTAREGIANLKAQIKVDMHAKRSGLFATKIDYSSSQNFFSQFRNKFELSNLDIGFLLQTVSNAFDNIFDNSLNPVIKCIALDLGGVYFDGDLDKFYEYLNDTYKIKIGRTKDDKLNISNKLMLGEINIQQFITEKTTTKHICKNLTEEQWDDILEEWGNTWKPNTNLKKLFEYIGDEGFIIIPFSNLDKDNGNKYIRENYLPACCNEHYFSYENNHFKPSPDAFEDFFEFAKKKYNINFPYQILLIDDQDKNISQAREKEWCTIKFLNGKNNLEYLIDELKKNGILPSKFNFRDELENK